MHSNIDYKKFTEMPFGQVPDVKKSVFDDFRSEEVQDIISQRPGFWGAWALPILLVVFLLILIGSWFVSYPDRIIADATLMATNAPREIISREQGKLTDLFVQNGDTVFQGQPIGWVETTADHLEVLELSSLLDTSVILLEEDKTKAVSNLFDKNYHSLGELQQAYQEFNTAWQQFNDYLVNGFYYKKKNSLKKDISFLKRSHESIDHQLGLNVKALALSFKDYEANKTLFEQKVLSAKNYRSAQKTYLDKQESIPQIKRALLANESQQINKQSEIRQLEHTISQQKRIFIQALHTLKSKVDSWITKYVIKAPVKGTVVLLTPLQENQFLQVNEVLGYVNPFNSHYYARLNFSQQNFGRVDTGQEVQLRLNAYPYAEFGVITGRLNYISNVSTDSGFLGNVVLSDGLVTVYNNQIQFRSGLHAQAIVITKNMRLIQRFYYNIMKRVDK